MPENPLSPTSSPHKEALATLGVPCRYRRGALLIQEGETGDSLYIVLKGRLRTFLAGGQGKELTLAVHGRLECVGEMLLDGGPSPVHVEALESCTCAVIARRVLLDYTAAHPEFALELMGNIIRRARMATESARSVALIDVYGRLVRLLDRMAEPPDALGARCLQEKMTHQQLSQHLACSREMVSRLLKDLETGGYIEVHERRIRLLKNLPARW
ncbi:MAG: Crp/Fnr family transcriptional regulator [Hydrogenophaga sp.]